MKNSSFFLMLLLTIVGGGRVFGQNHVDFNSLYRKTLQGDMIMVGNSILNVGDTRPANTPYVGSRDNNSRIGLQYADVDGDPSTFNSSSAFVSHPTSACLKVDKAYLYWSVAYTQERVNNQVNPKFERNKFNTVKFKTPNSVYQSFTGTRIYDGDHQLARKPNSEDSQRAYVYRADVTNMLLTEGAARNGSFSGDYTVANIMAPYGTEWSGVGYAAGWTLVIIYEDKNQTSKMITLFDGFSAITSTNRSLDISISGFQTIPSGSVKAKMGIAALEGELGIDGDGLLIKSALKPAGVPIDAPGGRFTTRPNTNFFNSRITDTAPTPNINRTPASTNLLGFDVAIFDIPNSANSLLDNNTTSVTLSPFTRQDSFYPFVVAFNVEVIAPAVVVEKKIYKVNGGTDVTGGTVNLGDKLRYEIKFKNEGTDDAKKLVLTDLLPKNLVYNNIISSVRFGWKSNPVAGTDYVYNPTNHTLIFNIPDHVVKKGGNWQKVSFEVKVPDTCDDLRDACSNVIDNVVTGTYFGVENTQITPFNVRSTDNYSACGNVEGPSTFIANLGTCVSKRKETLCQKTLDLVAGADFDTYAWTKGGSSTIIGTSQTLKVTETGTYKVLKKKTGCADMREEIEVVLHSTALATNPINQYASLVLTCGNDGSDYPQIYLCGTSATKLLQLNTAGAVSYNWQKRNNCTIPATHPDTCPVRDNYGCTWNTVHTGSSYNVSQGGDYRVEINYAGGCVQVFYFRVTKTELTPTVTTRDIICTKQGEITVTHPTSGYQYALRGSDGNIVVNYQNSNKFTVTNPDSYTVLIRQALPAGSTYTPCIFELPASIIRKNPNLAVAATPLACQNSKGSLQISVSDMFPPYTYVVRNASASGAVVYQVNATDTTNITVPNLNDGNYYVQVTSPDGCALSHPITINKLPELKATATVKRHLMCGEAVIRVEAQGGTPGTSYGYSIDGGNSYMYNYTGSFYEFTVTATGTYNVKVTDANNCSVNTSVTVNALTHPTFTTTSRLTDCGQKVALQINVTSNPSNFQIRYSVDGGLTSQIGNAFVGLTPGGTYTPSLLISSGSATCTLTSTVTLPPVNNAKITAAFAGVTELIGCGQGVNVDKAKVRVTNVQGGSGNYQYSFDNKATWITTSEAWLPAGTHNVFVRDKVNECEFGPMEVNVPNRPVAPNFTTSVAYDCEGRGSITVNNNQSGFLYTYEYNGNTYTSSTISGLPPGTHTITIKYADPTAPTPSILIKEDFGYGSYTPNPNVHPNYTYKYTSTIADGQYVVMPAGTITHPTSGPLANGCWTAPTDHTSPSDPTGRYLAMNVGSVGFNKPIYYKEVNDVIPDQEIRFEMYVYNLCHCTSCKPPIFAIRLVNTATGQIIGTQQNSGNVPVNGRVRGAWQRFSGTLAAPNVTSLRIEVVSMSPETNGNDLAIDDIFVYQVPKVCGFDAQVTAIVLPDKQFATNPNTRVVQNAKCHPTTTTTPNSKGKYQINLRNAAATGYYVSKDGGTWTLETANPFVWNDVSVGNHTVKFRYSATSTNCEITDTFEIKAPPAITVTPIPTQYLGCNPAKVTVTAVASGGTGAFTYALESNIGGVITTTPYQSSPSFEINSVGNYKIHVKDINECSVATSFRVDPAPPVTIAVATTSNYCVTTGGTGASITLNVTGTPPFVFRVNGAVHATTNNTSHTLTNLQPNTYVVTVTDAHRCTTTETIKIEPPLRVSASSVQHDITCRPAPNHRGRIQVNLEGGYGSNTYVVKRGTAIVQPQTPVTGTSIIYESDQPGTYTIEITDAKGCKTQVTHTLTQPVPPTFTYTQTNALCNGGRGSITVNVTSGIGGYTYILNGGTPQTSNIFNNLVAGIYTLTVRDAKHCDATVQTVTITEPVAIRGFAGVSQLIGCGTGANADKAKVRITNVTGGVPPYEYRFDGGWVSENEGWMPAGNNQSVWVRDANRCPFEMKVDVPQKLTPPVFTQTAVTYDCHGNGTVTINNDQSTYSYTYSVNGGTPTTTNTLTNLSPGNNIITIKYQQVHHEAQACDFTATQTVQVATDKEFRATAGTITQPSCHGGNDGSAQFFVENFATTGYRHRLNTGAWSTATTNSTLTIPNLTAGDHTLTLEHVGGGCIVTVPFKVTQPTALTLTSTLITPQKCSNTGATVRLTAGGGTPPYQYRLGTGMLQSSPDFSSVPHGTQIFTVQDAKGCPATTTVNLVAPKTVSFTATTQNCYSGNNDASIQVNVTDGNGDYKFSINNGAWITPTNPTTHTFGGLSNGTYTIRVLDSYDCTATQTLVIHPKLIMDLQTIDKSCNDGRITVTARGGDGNYQYGFAPTGTPMPTLGATNTYAVTTAGSYIVYLKSANCTISETVTIGTAPTVGATVTAKNPDCFGNNGTVALTNVTGHAPYTFALKNTVTPTISQTFNNVIATNYTFANVVSGTYSVTVTDRYGCVATYTATVTGKPQIMGIIKSTTTNCVTIGSVVPLELTVSQTIIDAYNLTGYDLFYSIDFGGTWSPLNPTNTISGFITGQQITVWFKTVPSGAGVGATAVCIEKMPTETVPLPLDNLTISTNLATFTNTCTAGGMEVVVGAKGGTGPYKFAILHSASDPIPAGSSTAWVTPTPANGTTHTFTGLVPGRSYRFLVLDNTNCVKENTQNLYENYVPPVHITATKVKPACHGTTTGTIEFTVTRSASSTTTAGNFTWEVYKIGQTAPVSTGSGVMMPAQGASVTLPPVAVQAPGTYYMLIKEAVTNCEWASANVEMRVLDQIEATARVITQDVTCDISGRILVENVLGGGGVYEYQLTSPAFVATITWTSNNPIEIPRSNINPSAPGTINVTVHVRDQYGCGFTLTTPLTLNVPAPPPAPTGTANSCSEPLSIQVTPAGANYEYALAGPTLRTWQTSNTFTNLQAGNYIVSIKDITTGCITTGTTTVTLHPMMQATVQQTKLLGCGTMNPAEIKIDVTAGSGSYDYEVEVGGVVVVPKVQLPTNTFTFTTSTAGTYDIHLYNNHTNCPAKTFTVEVAPAVVPSFTTTTVSVTCNGGNDGKIFIHEQVVGSTYTYTITPAIVPPATFNTAAKAFEGLSAGVYNITMTDINNGCATTVTVPVGQPAQITSAVGGLTATAFKCTTGNTSDAVVVTLDPTQVTEGTPPYTFQLVYDNGTTAITTDDITVNGTTMTVTNRRGGVVKAIITDANGCLNPPATPITVAIKPYDELKTATVSITNAITCVAGESVSVTVTSTSGDNTKWMYIQSDTPPALTHPAWQPANTFTNLPVGTHRFWVKHIETGCMISAVHTVKDPNTFVINTPVITNPDCKGGTGSANITLTDATYTGVYEYTVQSGTTTLPVGTTVGGATTQNISLSNLLAGTYTITVRQQTAPTCDKSYVFTVVEPAIALTASVTTEPITCVAPNTGVIEVINATGGWGDYRYRIGTGAWQSNPRFTGLTAGTYTVQISDKGGAGCISTVSATVVLTNPVPLTATMTIASQNCVAGSGVMSVTVSGGAGEGYTFELFRNGNFHAVLNTTTATTVMFTNLDAGAYHVEVSDVWGCQTITTATLSTTLHTPITNVHAMVMKEITCSTPTGGTVSITHSAGHSTNIRYAVTPPGGGATVTQINSGLFTNLLTAGIYTVEVYDMVTGCATESVTFELTPTVSPTFTTTRSDVKCNGGADGWFTVDVPQTQQHLDYQVVVTSTATGFVTQTRTVANVPTSLLFKDLSAGVYTVVVTSVRGCVTTDTVTIGEPTVVGVTATTTPFACDPSNLPQPVIITAVGNGGTAPYHYSIDGTDFTNTSGVFTTTDTGVTQTITVYVKDLHGGCATTTTVVVQPFPAIQGVSVVGTNRITCANPETIAVTITGGANQGYTVEGNRISGVGVVSPTTRTIIAGSSTTTFEITEVGMYEFKIIDNHTGCYTVTTYTVHPYNNIEIKVSPKVNTSCYGASDGVITLETTGYLGSYAYRVIDDATSLMVASGTATTTMASLPHRVDIGGLPTGMYKVELTENGIPFCTVTSTLVSVSGPTRALTATATIIAPLTCEGNNAVIDVQAQYGWGNYEYQLWMNGIPHPTYGTYTTTSAFVGLGVGNYEVKVRDMGGCELTASATATMTTITIAPPVPITLNLTSSVTQVSCYGDKSASITAVSVMGGSGNYKYVLISTIGTEVYESGAQDSPTFTNLGAGVYQVKVIDGWGCDQVSTVHITITEPTPVRLNATITKGLTCLTNAEITLVASGGSGTGYTFSTSPTGTFTVADVLSVPMGTYTYYAKDSNGCLSEVSNTIEILPIEPLTLTVDTTDAYVKCNGESTAEIRATAQGGLGNYQFELKGTLADGSVVTRTTLDGIFVGLATGTYQVTLKSDDCVTSTIHPIIINEAPALVWGTATSTDETCFGENNGTIKVMATGGTGSITYAISPRLDRAVTAEFINQQEYAPGTYLVRASDENGCYVDFDVTIQAATRLTAVLDVVTHEICFGAADATASITISGGKAPYHTAFNSNAVSATWTQSNDGRVYYDNLPAGENQVIFVKDANGCSTYVVIPSINAGVDLQLSATAKVECVSANTISSEVIVLVNSNYASLVTYALDGGTPQRNNIFTNVSSGTHTITVAHPNGCTTQTTVFVPHYDPLTVVTSTTQVSCNGESDASIVMQVTGGSASYTYRIAPNIGTFDLTTGTFRGLPAGTYEVSVRDNQLGCVLTEIFTFAEPDVLYVETGSVTETCYQVNDGQLFFEIKGGRPQYAYTLTAPDGTLVESATGIVQGQVISKTGLVPGTYQLLYSDDASLCTKTATIQVGKAPNIEPINSKAIKVQYQCRESWDNTSVSENYIELFFDNTILTASNTFYALNSTNLVDAVPFSEFIGNKAIIRNIPAGKDQYFTIFYKTCTYTIPVGQYFDVEEYDPLMLTDKTDPKSLNTIKVEATGGKAPYTYRFNGIISDDGNEYHIMPADKGYVTPDGKVIKQIDVEVLDDLGCTRTLTIEKEFIDIKIPNYFTPNGDGNNDDWGPNDPRSYPNMTIAIYDRYGRLIAQLEKGQRWDGTYEGKHLPTGDYWYIIRLNEDKDDSREFLGNMTLFR
ncbi:T9SS type B sorting domain-containing protein [Capnocytophaga canis]|uniref:T9SS type B sorting domain-containing protein n=1 Tax=Capnocytophaga canis TaxID=1848903 RepID=UPI001BB3A810|nr:T9SS type B sorting domain-containing protein [Capnocytophaga canis]